MHRIEKRYTQIIGQSQSITEVRTQIELAAGTFINVIIYGETGTGKELVARTIHNQSARKDGPFLAVQCNSYPEGLIENELFGHEAGAYTDAKLPKK